MKLSRQNKYVHLFITMMTSGMAFVTTYAINLVLTPYIMEHVGADAYGFVSLAKQFAQYAAVFTIALNSFASRYIAVNYYDGKKKNANVYFSSVFAGNIALAAAICSVVFIGILFLEHFLHIPEALVTDVKILFLFVFVSFFVSSVCSVFSSSAYIENKLDIVGIFKGVSYIAEALVLLICYLFFPTYVFYVGIGVLAAALVVGLSNVYICRKYTPDLWVRREDISFSAVRELLSVGIWNSVNQLGNILNDGLDLVICNLLLSSLSMGYLAVAKMIYSIFSSMFYIVNQAFQPIFLKSYSEKNMPAFLSELKFSMKISCLLSNLGFSGFVALGMVYYKLWIPNQDIEIIYWLTVVCILTCVFYGPMQPLYYIYTLTVKAAVPCVITIIGGALNVAGMYLLIRFTSLGVYAVVWTTVVITFIINEITNPLYMAHVLEISWYTFYPEMLRNLFSCLVMLGAFRLLNLFFAPTTWVTFIACAILYAGIGAAIHLLIVFSIKDWRRVFGIVKKRA